MVKFEELEQSLLTTKEYMALCRKYKTYNPFGRRSQWYGNPPPCWKMGESYATPEMAKINSGIDELRELLPALKAKSNEPVH